MNIISTKNLSLINSVKQLDPDLFHDWLLIVKDDQILGMFEIQPITKITGILHLHIKDEFQKQGTALKAVNELIEYLKENTIYQQLIGTIPISNTYIRSVVDKTTAICCGLIKDSIVIDNKKQDMLVFQLEVK